MEEHQNKKWWQFRKMSKKDYGRIAMAGLLLAFIKSGLPLGHWFFEFLSDIIITMGLISGVLWLKEKYNANNKNKAKIIFFIIVLIFCGIAGSVEDENKKKEQEKIMQDVIKEQKEKMVQDVIYNSETSLPENKKYVDITKKMFESIKVERKKLEATFNNTNLSDLLEYSSFKNVERMKEVVRELNLLMVAWGKYDKKMLEAVDNMQNDIRNMAIKDLGEKEGEKVYLSSKKYFDKNFVVAEKYNNAGRNYFNEIISLYNFLIVNYDDYEIDYDEHGEETIYFYSENSAYKFNQHTEEVNKLYDKYVLLEKEYNDYMNNVLGKYNISLDDIENSHAGTGL